MASVPSPPLSIGGSNGVWPGGDYGDSNGYSDGCRGGALTELTRNDAVELGDEDLRFSVTMERRDEDEGSDVSLLTGMTIPRDEDNKYGSGDEDEGKKTSWGGGQRRRRRAGGGGVAPLGIRVFFGDEDNGGGGPPPPLARPWCSRASRGAAGPGAMAPGEAGTAIGRH